MKFIPDHSVVTLTASLDGGERIKFAGKRHCIGIKKTDLRQLFHEFEQLDSGLAGRQEGTGLGLALTKKIVELQNGSITVESEFAKGATFTVVLPINSGPNARNSDAPTLNQG
jgi:signal transduction histidine kinase